jgi:hypothetical protein
MLAQKTQYIEEKTVPEEKTQGRPGKKDRRAIWILIFGWGLLLSIILMHLFTR